MSEEIEIGSVVQLKSGGPAMTVANLGESQLGTMTAWCEWFDEKRQPRKETFTLTVLKLYKPQTLSRPMLRG